MLESKVVFEASQYLRVVGMTAQSVVRSGSGMQSRTCQISIYITGTALLETESPGPFCW